MHGSSQACSAARRAPAGPPPHRPGPAGFCLPAEARAQLAVFGTYSAMRAASFPLCCAAGGPARVHSGHLPALVHRYYHIFLQYGIIKFNQNCDGPHRAARGARGAWPRRARAAAPGAEKGGAGLAAKLRAQVLQSLSKDYPTVAAATEEIINLNAILKLPKPTEHFMSDVHGEAEAFGHILSSASGVIREKVDRVLGPWRARARARRVCRADLLPRAQAGTAEAPAKRFGRVVPPDALPAD